MTDAEATHALAAAATASQPSQFWLEGGEPVPSSPAHYALASTIFAFVGTDEIGARIIPATFGIGLIVLALFLPGVGRKIVVLLAICMSLSTVLITTARTSGGAMISGFALLLIVMALLTEHFERHRDLKVVAIGIGIGLGLASGPHFYTGFLSLILAAVVLYVMRKRFTGTEDFDIPSSIGMLERRDWLLGVALALIACFGFATLFGLRSGGIAGIPEGFGIWLQGWTGAGEFNAITFLLMLPIYEPLLVLLAVIGVIWSVRHRDYLSIAFSLWAIVALLISVIYPGRSAEDLIWVVIPLCLLAAYGLSQLLEKILAVDNLLVYLGFTAALIVLLIFSYLQLAAYAQNPDGVPGGIDPGIGNLGLALLALGLCGVVGVLIGLGWSWDMARISLGSAFAIILLAYSLASIWGLNFRMRAASARELWRPSASTIGLPIMMESLENISQAQTGLNYALPIQLYDEPTASLAWGLRQFERFENPEGNLEAPPIVLAVERESGPRLRADYIGQTFKIAERQAWNTILPPNFLQWIIQRNPPTVPEHWLLLLRGDLTGTEKLDETEVSESS
jgi:hypothetical protein